MRILHTTATYRKDCHGVSGAVRDLVQGLSDAGHEVSVLAPAEKGVPRENGVMRVKMDRSGGIDAKTLTRARSLKPDLIHIHDPIALSEPALELARRLDVPVAFTLHRPRPGKKNDTRGHVYLRASGDMVAASDLVVAPSAGARKWAAAHAKRCEVTIIPTGIPEAYRSAPSSRDAARAKREFATHDFVVGLVGSGRSGNGLEAAMAAILQLLDESPSTRLALTGTDTYRRKVVKMIPAETRDRAVRNEKAPQEGELVAWMDSLDLLIAPSGADPEGRNACLAMARGIAVLTPHSAPWARILNEGQNGFLAKKEGAAEFTAALSSARRTLRTRRDAIAIAAKKTVDRLTLERTVALHSSAYESLRRRKARDAAPS